MHRLEYYLTLQRGHDLPIQNREDGKVPVISSSGITGYHSKAKAEGPGVITGRCGTLGEVFYEKKDYWPLNTTLYVKDFKGNDSEFIYYFLKALNFDHLSSTSAVPGLDRKVLHGLKVEIPQIATQKKIVSILSAYDELIKNNNERIALLEEMAEEFYKEWFVRFRFPGHETVRFHDGLPEGWYRERLGEVLHITMGQSPKSEFYNMDKIGLPFHQGVSNFGKRFPEHMTYCTEEKKMADNGDILLSVRAPVGRINIASCKLIIGRGLAAVRHIDNMQSYCYYLLKDVFHKEDSFGNGAVFNAVSKKDLEGIKITKPDQAVINKINLTICQHLLTKK